MNNKICLVEDDDSICDIVVSYLSSENFSAEVFRNAATAITAFSSESDYALVLVDLMLPDISGMEVIKAIRKTSIVPIIIITARDNDTDKSMGLNFSVLNAALVISEYNNKTILLMFTYPVDKKKIILSKLLFITLFMAVSMLIGYAFCSLYIVGVDKKFDLLAGDFSSAILEDWLSGAFVTTIVFCCLGLLTFVVGMIRKSVSVTIVSSMIFIFLRQLVITAGERNQENLSLAFMTVVITFAAMWYTFAKNITQLD